MVKAGDRINRRAAFVASDAESLTVSQRPLCQITEEGHPEETSSGTCARHTRKVFATGDATDNESVYTITTSDSTNQSRDESTVQQVRTPPPSPRSFPALRSKQQQKYQFNERRSVLILGVAGKTGMECIRQFANSQNPPLIYGLCRDMGEMSEDHMLLCMAHCEELIVGDATRPVDLYRALQISGADTIIICIGSVNSSRAAREYVRTRCAAALVKVLVHPPFHHVRLVVVSTATLRAASAASGSSGSNVSCIVPQAVHSVLFWGGSTRHHSRYDVQDHQGQEDIFNQNQTIRQRTTIVRPTIFTRNTKTRRLATFKETDHQPPGNRTDRKDLARWLVTESTYHIYSGHTVHVTSV